LLELSSLHISITIAHEIPALDDRMYDVNEMGTNVVCQLHLLSFLHSQLYTIDELHLCMWYVEHCCL
jgi:multisubunit Na+/H+ antiporter MnhF subunit